MSNYTYRENVANGNARVYNGNIHGDVIDHDNEYKYYNNTYIGHHKRDPPKGTDYGRALIEAARAGSLKRTERYLNYNIELDLPDEEGRTALHWASRKGFESIARALLEAHCNVDAFSKSFGTPLCEAAVTSRGSIVQLLVEHGADVDLADEESRTALHWAAHSGHEGIAQALIDAHCNIDATSEKHGTPLCLAALAGKASLVQLLLEHGANVAADCGRHGSALHAACFAGSPVIVKLLLDDGAYVNAFRFRDLLDEFSLVQKDDAGHWKPNLNLRYTAGPALYVAASKGHDEVVSVLISAGADVLAQCVVSKTPIEKSREGCKKVLKAPGYFGREFSGFWAGCPLHVAAYMGNVSTLEPLMTGISHQERLVESGTVLTCHMAYRHSRHPEWFHREIEHIAGALGPSSTQLFSTALIMAAYVGHQECAEILLDHISVPADELASFLAGPLLSTVQSGQQNIAELLLTQGASASIGDSFNITPLHCASNAGCVKLLAGYGACMDARDKYGYTPLMSQALRGDLAAVEAMLDLGASIKKVNTNGMNALDYAIWNDSTEVAKLLEEHGAKPAVVQPKSAKWPPFTTTGLHFRPSKLSRLRRITPVLFDPR